MWNMVRALSSPRILHCFCYRVLLTIRFLCRFFEETSKRATECTSATLPNRPVCAKHRDIMVSGSFITNADRKLNAQVSELKHHLQTLEPGDISLQCNVCFENQEGWVRFGCGHYVCQVCNDKLALVPSVSQLCPICREPLHRRDSRRFRISVRPPPPVTSLESWTYAPSSPLSSSPSSPARSPSSPGYDPTGASSPPHRRRSPSPPTYAPSSPAYPRYDATEGSSPPHRGRSPSPPRITRAGNHRGRSPRRQRSETPDLPHQDSQTRDEELLARAIRESQRTYTLEQNARRLYTEQSVIVLD